MWFLKEVIFWIKFVCVVICKKLGDLGGVFVVFEDC